MEILKKVEEKTINMMKFIVNQNQNRRNFKIHCRFKKEMKKICKIIMIIILRNNHQTKRKIPRKKMNKVHVVEHNSE